MLQAGITLAGHSIESGARSFAAYAEVMIEHLGEQVRPWLRSWYEGARHAPGFDSSGMSGDEEIRAWERMRGSGGATIDVADKPTTGGKKDAGRRGDRAEDDNRGVRRDDPGSLAELSASAVAKADQKTNVAQGDAKDRKAGKGSGGRTDAGTRVAAPRSRRAGAAEADLVAAGKTDDRKQGVGSGDAREGDGDLARAPAAIPAAGYRITAETELGAGGAVTHYKNNIAAIRMLKMLEREDRRATPERWRAGAESRSVDLFYDLCSVDLSTLERSRISCYRHFLTWVKQM